jgi:hypothetical protein
MALKRNIASKFAGTMIDIDPTIDITAVFIAEIKACGTATPASLSRKSSGIVS